MTAIEKARQFLAAKSCKLALTVVPLAVAAAGVASAGTFGIGGCSASPQGSMVTGGSGCQVTSIAGVNPTIENQVVLSGDVTVQVLPEISLYGVTFNAGQSGGGTFMGNIPVYWDFFATASNGGNIDWTVTFTVNGFFSGGSFPYVYTTSGSVTGSGEVSGMSEIIGPVDTMDLGSWSIELQVSQNGSGADTLHVQVPGNSTLHLNGPAGATVPEPSTGLLAIPALGAFLVMRRKKG